MVKKVAGVSLPGGALDNLRVTGARQEFLNKQADLANRWLEGQKRQTAVITRLMAQRDKVLAICNQYGEDEEEYRLVQQIIQALTEEEDGETK